MSVREAMKCEPRGTFVDYLRSRAATQPTKTAYTIISAYAEPQSITYGQLDRQATTIAAELLRSAAPGDRAVLIYPTGLEFITALFGCLYASIVAVPVYPPDPMRWEISLARFLGIVRDAGATIGLTTTEFLDAGQELLLRAPDPPPLRWLTTNAIESTDCSDDTLHRPVKGSLAVLQYTSGSTGDPRGVMLSHANLLAAQEAIQAACQTCQTDVAVGWAPLYHDLGLAAYVFHTIYAGIHTVLMSPIDFLQRPMRWLQAISDWRATISGGPNFAYELCVRKAGPADRQSLDLSSWAVAFNGAEPVRAQTLDRFSEAFREAGFRRESFLVGYGLAEATLPVSGSIRGHGPNIREASATGLSGGRIEAPSREEDAVHVVSCGEILAGFEVAIVNPQSLERCGGAAVGEVWARGPAIGMGYWGRNAETSATFHARIRGESPALTWLRTGDLGFIENGQLYIVGRLKDLVVLDGRNHYPQDLEQTAETSHAMLRPGCSAAFSVVAEQERLVLVLEVRSREVGAHARDLFASINQAVSCTHGVRPHAIILVAPATIPKTSSGKIRRAACREAFLLSQLEVIARWPEPILRANDELEIAEARRGDG